MLKKTIIIISIFQLGTLFSGVTHASGGVNMITGDDALTNYQTVVRDGTVEWQGPEVTVRVVNNEVFVIKNGATIKIVDELVEVSGGEALQVRKVEQPKPAQDMGSGVNMINGQFVQSGGVDMNTGAVNGKAIAPSTITTDKSFTGKFFRKLGIE
ncbi:MAG: hypothetical protein IT572_03545 [Deltaproteobacteria bacterium]|nr:hypothetical protein [Deltaproteobacteria bacterium]